MKVAFLHGCCQTNEMFKSLSKEYKEMLRKKYKDCDFVYIEGQYDHSRTGKTWYKTELDLSLIGTDHIPDVHINETLDYVESIIRHEGVSILVGFSQGGNVIDTYLRWRNADSHIKSALILNGYSFPRYHHLTPTVDLLVYVSSENDEIVNHELLHTNYTSIVTFQHDKGHKLNTSKPFVRTIVSNL